MLLLLLLLALLVLVRLAVAVARRAVRAEVSVCFALVVVMMWSSCWCQRPGSLHFRCSCWHKAPPAAAAAVDDACDSGGCAFAAGRVVFVDMFLNIFVPTSLLQIGFWLEAVFRLSSSWCGC